MKLDLQRLTATGAIALGYAAQMMAQSAKEPMNIVYIMSDDHSYQTISAYDHRFIETPNIDWIARHTVHKQLRGQLDAYEPKRSMRYQRALFFPTQKTGKFNSKITNFKVE